MQPEIVQELLLQRLGQVIAQTNGISVADTLELLAYETRNEPILHYVVTEFLNMLELYHIDRAKIEDLLNHPVSQALEDFFRFFPLRFHEEHIHLTGSLTAEFIYDRVNRILEGPNGELIKKKLIEVYGPEIWPIDSIQKIDNFIRLKEYQSFKDYLRILYLGKIILVDRQSHQESAYHLAKELYYRYNIGRLRLKFTVSRASKVSHEQIPGSESLSVEDVILGLFEGFKQFQKSHPDFDFVLSPSFRKESEFYDATRFSSRRQHFESLVDEIVRLIEVYPELRDHLLDVDTVGDETQLYRKEHFNEFKKGFRKLQYLGIKIRSHHGETFQNLRKGIQAVDNALNIWHVDTLEHGLSLGINPNYYFHRIYQKTMEKNSAAQPITNDDMLYHELMDLEWDQDHRYILEKLLRGEPLAEIEKTIFIKTKFHTARELEHYQHDVLNRMIQKGVGLVTLPSSNRKLTGQIDDYKDHPFSWWEKKGVQLGLGTDNYVTLNTNFIREMLIMLYSDPYDLKIMKLLMVTTKENRRPYLSHLLWRLHKQLTPLGQFNV